AGVAPVLAGERYAALPDPYAPLIELWASGYGDDGVALLAPDLPFA
ncbi:MAG: hypothetical protein JWM10_1703, partial [Myxococcaceae bacterium]|nr:hypothetical protein [Myxococcaceae bacterium]